MKHIYSYEDYINESVDWKSVKKYGKGLLLGLLIGGTFMPDSMRQELTKPLAKKAISLTLKSLDDELAEGMSEIISEVIDRVKNSKNILNKDEVINRLKGVKFKRYSDSFLLNGVMDDTYMSYIHDIVTDIDYIITNTDKNLDYNSIIHELNHLVDKHAVMKANVDISSILNNDLKLNLYKNYFKNFRKINSEFLNDMVAYDLSGITDNSKSIPLYTLAYYKVVKDKKYLLSESELTARINVMKNDMVYFNILNRNEDITTIHMKKLKNVLINILKDNNEKEIILTIHKKDYFFLLPLIEKNLKSTNLITYVSSKSNIFS